MINTEIEAREFIQALGSTDDAIAKLELLSARLREENELQNLVARPTLNTIWQRHIADSAQLLRHCDPDTLSDPWLDLGSGAGFPGLVIAVLRPGLPVILVESRKRRVTWLATMVEELGLTNCRIEGGRLEELDTFQAGVISARAFAPLQRLLRLSARFSTSRTRWLLPKGRSAAQEVRDLPKSAASMFHVEQSLTDADAGIVIGTGRWKAGL